MEQYITLNEALNQGYTSYAHHNDGFGALMDLEHITPEEIDEYHCYLVEKDGYAPIGISEDEMKDWLSDYLEDINHETQDDTGAITQAIKAIDFKDIVSKIQESLSGIQYYKITKTKLKN